MESASRPNQDPRKYVVRPFSRPARTDYKDAFRIYLAPAALLLYQLRAGDPCYIWVEDSAKHTAIAWPSPEKTQDTVVQTSKTLQNAYGFRLGDRVSLAKRGDPVANSVLVFLQDLEPRVGSQGSPDVRESLAFGGSDNAGWEWFLEYPLAKAEYIAAGMVLEGLECKGQKRSFRVEKISPSTPSELSEPNDSKSLSFCQFGVNSGIKISTDITPSATGSPTGAKRLHLRPVAIGGLASQINSLNQLFTVFDRPNYGIPLRLGGPGGILLYGPPGTGKSLLLAEIASTEWGKIFTLDTSIIGRFVGESEAAIRRVFSDAKRQQPSIIIIDELDSFAPKRSRSSETGELKIVSTLVAELNDLNTASRGANFSRVLVIAATSRPNDIDESLRRPGRFESEVEIPIPDADARTQILKVLLNIPIDTRDGLLEWLGERTHGFVGADLQAVLKKAITNAITRSECSQVGTNSGTERLSINASGQSEGDFHAAKASSIYTLTQGDIDTALLEVRPTAMREVYLEPPKVRWTDIGGQEEVKQSLREAVEWPLKHPEIMAELGITATKGLLLYGPPGCSKTLTAQALATEAGLNFIAVKGAELLNMYVGESERAVREVFRKARAASPSIIFFDEIDAIGSTREGGRGNGVNVLTTLLNEMDGIEILKGVVVLAATNKPEILDPALMRPGRLDTILYVGPPDRVARRDILKIKMSKMKTAEDVDIEELTDRMDGHSGAEIISICDKAGHGAMKDCLKHGKIKPITKLHFDSALQKVDRQITPAMRLRYEQWSVGGTKKL
ncbi:MAG: AAA+-type ATPase [Geoglossum umbratile]|nr:MAG: AAA+-type ATPase [Geoglossum umbratile]